MTAYKGQSCLLIHSVNDIFKIIEAAKNIGATKKRTKQRQKRII